LTYNLFCFTNYRFSFNHTRNCYYSTALLQADE